VYCRQTRDAVLALYVVGIAGGLAVWKFGGALNGFNPLWVLDSDVAADVGELGRRLGLAALDWSVLGGGCLSLASWLLKPVYLRELEGAPAKSFSRGFGRRPSVDDEPVRWRERNVEGLSPVRSLRGIPQWLTITILALTTTVSSLLILSSALSPSAA